MPETPLHRIFVVGAPRSGTTVLQRLLTEQAGFFSTPETRFFQHLVGNATQRCFPRTPPSEPIWQRVSSQLRERMGIGTRLAWKEAPFPRPNSRTGRPWMREAAQEFIQGMDKLTWEYDSPGWVEKSPVHVYYWEYIERYVPDAVILHILRNGQEVVASMRDAAHKYRSHWQHRYPEIGPAIEHWNSSMQASSRAVGRPNHVFLHYEDLTEAPETAFGHLASRMGVSGAPRERTKQTPDLSLTYARETWKAEALQQPIRRSASKWDTALTGTERETARARLLPLPEALEDALEDFRAGLAGAGSPV